MEDDRIARKSGSRNLSFLEIVAGLGFAIILIIVHGCYTSDKSKESISSPLSMPISNDLNKEQKILAAKAIPKIIDTCPGLTRYGKILEFKGMGYSPKDEKGISVKFFVPHGETGIPMKYYAFGHNCEIYVDRNASTITSTKDVCVAVLLDREIKGTELDMHGSDIVIQLK